MLLISVFCCFISLCTAAQIYLTANPPVLTAYPRSKSFVLSCSLEQKQETDPPVKTIVSITLLKNRDVNILASIAADNHPITYSGNDVHSVAGSVNQNIATDYLQLTWIEPKINDARQYTCLIEALDLLGHIVRFETTVSVPVQLPGVLDLLNYSENLEGLVNSLTPHYEEGIVVCPKSDTYTSVPANTHMWRHLERIHTIYVTFDKPYTKKPVVVVSPFYVDVAKEANARYYISKENVTERGFQIVCGTWWEDTLIYELRVQWVAMKA